MKKKPTAASVFEISVRVKTTLSRTEIRNRINHRDLEYQIVDTIARSLSIKESDTPVEVTREIEVENLGAR